MFLPAQVLVNSDGLFAITTVVDFYGVIATIFAPGAGQIAAFNGFSAQGAGLGVFAGSPLVSTLSIPAGSLHPARPRPIALARYC